jgi:hypothetical protein
VTGSIDDWYLDREGARDPSSSDDEHVAWESDSWLLHARSDRLSAGSAEPDADSRLPPEQKASADAATRRPGAGPQPGVESEAVALDVAANALRRRKPNWTGARLVAQLLKDHSQASIEDALGAVMRLQLGRSRTLHPAQAGPLIARCRPDTEAAELVQAFRAVGFSAALAAVAGARVSAEGAPVLQAQFSATSAPRSLAAEARLSEAHLPPHAGTPTAPAALPGYVCRSCGCSISSQALCRC